MKDDAVSSVVSAVLIFSLVSTASLLWTMNELPDWIEAKEANHLTTVRQSFGALQAGAERMSASDDAGPISQQLTLGAPPVPFLQRSASSGSLGLLDDFRVEMTTSDGTPNLLVVGSSPAGTPDAPLSTGMALVDEIEHLHATFRSSGVTGPNEIVRLRMTATDAFAKSVHVDIVETDSNANPDFGGRSACLSRELRVTVTSTIGTQSHHALLCGVAQNIAAYTVNLLDPQFNVVAQLAELEPGYAASWSTSGSGTASGSTYLAVWQDTDGATRAAGSGASGAYVFDEESKSLRYRSSTFEHPNQQFIWQGGATVLDQAAGGTLAVEPDLRLEQVGDQGFMRWTMAALQGEGSVSGNGEANIQIRHVGTRDVVLTTEDAHFAVTTEHARGWVSHINALRTAGGVALATAALTPDGFTLDLANGGVVPQTWTIHLRVIDIEVRIS